MLKLIIQNRFRGFVFDIYFCESLRMSFRSCQISELVNARPSRPVGQQTLFLSRQNGLALASAYLVSSTAAARESYAVYSTL